MASPVPVTAQLVGHAFVSQYYNVLHQWPQLGYRFYTDASRLTRSEAGPDGTVIYARNQREIYDAVMSMGFHDCNAEIVTVDSSESIGGSVLVLVTGVMHRKRSNGKRSFVQTFLLAPQERGYYVLNDIFRYLDEESQSAVPMHKVPNGSLDMFERLHMGSAEADGKARSYPQAAVANEVVASEVPLQEYVEHPHTNVLNADLAGSEDRVPHQTLEVVPTERLAAPEQLSIVEDSRSFDDGSSDKKSYASILRFPRDSAGVGAQPAASFVSSHLQVNEQPPNYSYQSNTAGLLASPPAGAIVVDDSNYETAELKSVYVKNLPIGVAQSQLEDELVRVGCSRPSNVVLKSYKDGGVYAFVDFDDSRSALNAIEASPVMVGGKRAHIEERKSTYTGPSRGRGRATGRGSLSNAGGRGRSSFIAGTSSRGALAYGENDSSARARGSRPARSGYGGLMTRV